MSKGSTAATVSETRTPRAFAAHAEIRNLCCEGVSANSRAAIDATEIVCKYGF
jgi:hypothetical protein